MTYSRSTVFETRAPFFPEQLRVAFQVQTTTAMVISTTYSVTTTIIQTLGNWGRITHSCFLNCISCPWMLRLANLEVQRRREWELSNIFTVYNANLCWEYFCLLMIGNKVIFTLPAFLFHGKKYVILFTALFSLRELHCTIFRAWAHIL